MIVVFPPLRFAKPVMLATLVTVPPDWVRFATVPPVRLAVPVEISTAPRVAFALNVPAVIFDSPVTVAPFRLVMLLEAIEAKVPPVAFRLPALVVAPIVPAEILAVPEAPTVRLVRLAALINVPPVTFADAPEPAVTLVVASVTLTEPPETVTFERLISVIKAPADETLPVRLPPVRLAVPLAPTVRSYRIALAVKVPPVTLARPVTFAVPPVMFVIPAVRIEPISPSVILAVPEAPTVRLVTSAALISVPPVTFADAAEPAVMLVVPVVTLTEPAETVTFPRSIAVIKAPADKTLPVRLPPVRLAVTLDPTVRFPRVELAVKVPAVTFVRPVTVEPVRSVMLLVTIEENVPPVAFRVPEVLVAPTFPDKILAVAAAPTARLPMFADDSSRPPVILARLVTEPPVRVVVPAEIASEPRTAALSSVPSEFTTLAVPPVRLAVALDPIVRLPRLALAEKVPADTFVRPVTVAPVRSVMLLVTIEVNVPPVAFRVPEELVAPTFPDEILAVAAAPTARLPMFADDSSKPPVILARFVTDPAVRVDVPAVTTSEFKTAALSKVPAEFTRLAVPPVRFAVAPDPTVRFPTVALAVNVPPVTFDNPVTVALFRFVTFDELIEANVPPIAFNVPETLVDPIVPAEIFPVPAAPTVRLPRFADDSSKPPVIFARFVTDPAVSVDVPAVTISEFKTAALSKVPAEFTRLAVPPVRLAVAPDPTVRFPSVALAVNAPPVTFESPVTVAPVKFVILLELIVANVPPVAFNVPETLVAPIVPAEILAIPAAPAVRLPRFAADSSNPPVTFARFVTDPAVSVDVPAVTISEFKTAALSKVPDEFTTLAVPPVRLAVPDELIVKFPSVALAENVPAVTFDKPVTVAPVKLVILLELIDANVPPVAFRVPDTFVAPMLPAEIFAVPAAPAVRLPRFTVEMKTPPVTFARFVTEPAVSVDDPADIVSELKSAVLLKIPAEFTTLAVPPVRLAVPDKPIVKFPSVELAVNVPPVTFDRPVTVAPVKFVILLELTDANVPPVAFNEPDTFVAPIVPAEIFAVPAAPTVRLPRLTVEMKTPPVTFARFVTDPDVSVDVPADIVSELKTAALLRFPDEITTLAVPPVRLAVAPEPTVRFPKAILAVIVPAVTSDSPVTVPPVKLVVPLVVNVFRVPPVTFKVPAELVAPVIVPPVIFAVPA